MDVDAEKRRFSEKASDVAVVPLCSGRLSLDAGDANSNFGGGHAVQHRFYRCRREWTAPSRRL